METTPHAPLQTLALRVQGSDSRETTCSYISELVENAKKGSDAEKTRFSTLFSKLVDPERREDLEQEERVELLTLIQRLELQHCIRCAERLVGCCMHRQWEIRTLPQDMKEAMLASVRQEIDRMKENGLVRVEVGAVVANANPYFGEPEVPMFDIAFRAEFDESVEAESPYVHWGFTRWETRAPSHFSGFKLATADDELLYPIVIFEA